jgi:SPP1 gp7 family putative phage head morphogenesis protein
MAKLTIEEAWERNKKNIKYWHDREEEQLRHNIKEEAEYDKQLKKIYQDMLDACQSEINAFYGRYAEKEGITITGAKRRVSKADIEAYERKAKRYVKDKDLSAEANEEMRLYNLMMKVNRLEMLKANLGLELIDGHDKLEKFMGRVLKGRTEDELKRQAGILGKTVQNNARMADSIVNASFHNATFSNRIWMYQDMMRDDISKMLQTGLIQGKNPRAIMKDLKKYWYGNDPATGGGQLFCMERLMRTELARVQTEAQKQSFEKNGFKEYTFHVNTGCCDICAALDGKHFKVEDMKAGENAPPMHPHCRCSTSAYEDSAEYEAWLDYLEAGGSTEEWNKMGRLVWEYENKPKETDSFAQKLESVELSPHIQEYKTVEEFWDAQRLFKGKRTDYLEDVFAGNVELQTSWAGDDGKRKIAQIENTIAELQKKYPMNPSKKLEYGTTYSRINVCDYEHAWIYLPDGKRDRRLTTDAVGQVFSNDNVLTIAFDRAYMYRTLGEDIESRGRAIANKKTVDFVGGESPQGVVIHEWGHVMSNHITNAFIYDESVAHDYWDWYQSLSKEDIRAGLSDYATVNRGEFEAECFAELQMPNPRPLALKYKEYLDKCIEKGY